jgi:xanthine dehydrogenase large subunit
VKLHRALDMQLTGKRHPFLARYEVGFDDDGLLHGAARRAGRRRRLELRPVPPVLMRAMVHVDNAYFVPDIEISGLIARTHLASNTAFRGFGGPQGMLVGEEVLARVARHLGLPAHEVRERNFYRPATDGNGDRNQTHYGQPVVDNHLPALWTQLLRDSDFLARREAIDAFNAGSAQRKRGIAVTPVKFGISFNKTEYNQAGALVHIYSDGSVQLNHGGTEMGQGLHAKMRAIASRMSSASTSSAHSDHADSATDKVPNTSATAASFGRRSQWPGREAPPASTLRRAH